MSKTTDEQLAVAIAAFRLAIEELSVAILVLAGAVLAGLVFHACVST